MKAVTPRKPTPAEIAAATDKLVRDVIAPDLQVLFCGINPGLYSAAVGLHFARPGNRFWPTLYAAGFTPRLLAPHEQRLLLEYGYGITNLVARASVGADELTPDELAAGGKKLRARVERYQPRCLAVLGVGAYRSAFGRPKAPLGRQAERMGEALIWVLPNPSGLNANYQREALARLFAELRQAVNDAG